MAMEADLRAQALGLISDAQTADRKDREVYLRQVQELCLRRAPRLLDEVVPLLISEFQADPQPTTRKFLVEFLEEVVKAYPTFCQPSMVDVYSHMLQHDNSPQIVKRVLVACANVNACVFKYAATSGLPHLWEDYCHRIKNVILRMAERPDADLRDAGLGIIRYMEALVFCAFPPSRSSTTVSRPNDTFTVADVPPDQQRAFQVIELRQEAEELVRLLLRWVTEGKAGFGPPHYTTLINTLSAIATHRNQFLPIIAATLADSLTATQTSRRSGPLHSPGVAQALKATCLKLIRLPSARSFPPSLQQLADALRLAGMEDQLASLNIPSHLKRPLPQPPQQQPPQPQQPPPAAPSSSSGSSGGSSSATSGKRAPSPLLGEDTATMKRLKSHDSLLETPQPDNVFQMPWDWYDKEGPERVDFVLSSLAQAAMPPAPFRDRQLGYPEPVVVVERFIRDLSPGGHPDVDLGFIRSVVKERPMNVEAMEVVEGEEGAAAEGGASAAVTTIEEVSPEEEERKREEDCRRQEALALERLLERQEEAHEFGMGGLRIQLLGRLSSVLARPQPKEGEGVEAPAPASQQQVFAPLVAYVGEDVTGRREVAESVLYEMFLAAVVPDEAGQDGEQGEGKEEVDDEERFRAYDDVMVRMVARLLARMDAKEKGMTQLVLCAPRVPLRLVDVLSDAVEEKGGARLMQGLMTLTDLAIYRPGKLRSECLRRVLSLTEHENADIRRRAIQNAVVKRLYTLEDMREQIEAHAKQQLDSLAQPTPTASGGKGPSLWTGDEVKRKLYLYLALCSKNDVLIPGLFEAYSQAGSDAVREVLEGEAEAIVQHVLKPHGTGTTLQSLVACSPGASPLILRCLNILVPETQQRPRPPPPDVVTAAKTLRQIRGGDVAYVLPVLGGLNKEEVLEVLPSLIEQDKVDEKTVRRLITPYGTMTAADALVTLHQVDPEATKVPLKKYLDVLQQCLNMKTLFPQPPLTLALVKMVEDKNQPVPYAYMRTAILAIKMYPTALKPTIADSVVPKLVDRQIWVSQPRVWEGVVLLPKYLGVRDTTDKMADALLSLPLQQLQEVMKKSPEVKGTLATHVSRHKKTATLDPAKRKAIGL